MNTDTWDIAELELRSPEGRKRFLDLWHHAMPEAFPLDAKLLEQQVRMEANSSLCLCARDPDGHDCGIVLAKQNDKALGDRGSFPAQGCISALMVHPERRRRGLGSALLARAEAWLGGRGVRTLHWGRDTCHFFPGAPEEFPWLPPFLKARGFVASPGLVHDFQAPLQAVDLGPGSAERQGSVVARNYEPSLRPALEDFFARAFPGRWQREVFDALDTRPPLEGHDLILLVEEQAAEGQDSPPKVLGFARVGTADSAVLGPGLFWRGLMGPAPCALGPIGVDPAMRGRGLGIFLLRAGIKALKDRGGGTCVIDWTDLADFYGKLGFTIWKTYRNYTKELAG